LNGKERCLAAIAGEPVDRVPVFPLLMFFAQERLGVTYREFATNAHAMAEAQLKALESFGVDAITACTDAFRVSADLGGEMVFPEQKPPYLARPLVVEPADLRRLRRPDPTTRDSRMDDRVRGVRELADAAGEKCLVLGWVDMPFAEACAICGVSNFMILLYENPELAREILEFLTDVVIDFAHAQVAAGAPMVGAGDAAASLISPAHYREFALPYEQRVCAAVGKAGGMVKLHVCGDTTALLPDMATCGAQLFNVDHCVDFAAARDAYAEAGVCFKGNLDPVADMLQATPDTCAARAAECLRLARGTRYMLSPGCEVPAATSDEVFHAFCEAPRAAGE
jgi:MtaA/CmuA family methyltransferase